MTKLWDSLNGKKTILGAGIATGVSCFTALGMIWGWDHLIWWPKALETGDLIAGVVSGTGILHKFIKSQNT